VISVRQPQEQTMTNERREFSRHQVRKNGKIVFVDQPFFVECIIRNISQDGALLSLLIPVVLPQEVLLWEEKTGRSYECLIRWRRDHMVGVHFIDVRGRAERRALFDRRFAPFSPAHEPPPTAH
jgi:hypothetical protein